MGMGKDVEQRDCDYKTAHFFSCCSVLISTAFMHNKWWWLLQAAVH